MDPANLAVIFQVSFFVALGMTYGVAMSLYYWRVDCKTKEETSFMRGALWVFGLPIVLAGIAFLMPGEDKMQVLLGSAFGAYSAFSIASMSYLPPAVIAALIVIATKASLKRWLYASLVFGVGMVFVLIRLISVLSYAKAHPDLVH